MSDICLSIDQYIQDEENSNNTAITQILKCLTNSSYSPVQAFVNEKLNETLGSINNVTQECCNMTFDYITIRHLNISSFPPLFQPVIAEYYSDLQIYFTIIDDILVLSNCSFVSDTFKKLKDIICNDMVNALTIIMGCNATIGILFVPMTILAIVGWKRFPAPKGDMDNESNDEWEEFKETSKPTQPTQYDAIGAKTTETGLNNYQPISHNPPDEELPPYAHQNVMPTNYAPIENKPNTPRHSIGLYPDIPDEPDFNPSAPMQTLSRDQLSEEDMQRLRNEDRYNY